MAEFSIVTERVKRHTEEFDQYSDLLADYTDQIARLGASASSLGGSTERIRAALRTASSHVETEMRTTQNMGVRLYEIITLFELTEKRICDQAGGSMAVQTAKDITEGKSDAGTSGKAEDEGVWDFILDALKQAVMGDFYTDDGNWLGVALSVGIGFIPYVGQAADIRDLVADIYHLIDGGPTPDEWVSLGFTLVGIIPGVGDALKHGDEVGDAVKGLLRNFDHADEVADAVKNFMRKGDGIFSAVGNKIDDFNDLFKHNVLDKVDDLIDSHTASRTAKEWINHSVDTVKNWDFYQDVDRILDRLDYSNGSFEISAKKFIEGMVDEYVGDYEENTLTKILNYFSGEESQTADAT